MCLTQGSSPFVALRDESEAYGPLMELLRVSGVVDAFLLPSYTKVFWCFSQSD